MLIDKLDFSIAKIFVFGDVMIDHYWYGSTSRISPEAPVPVVLYNDQNSTLGGAANVARNLVAYGSHATLSGLTGEDEDAKLLKKLCEEISLPYFFLAFPNIKTTKKLRILSRHQQLLRVDFEDSLVSKFSIEKAIEDIGGQLEQAIIDSDVVILSDYLKGARELFPTIIALANKYKKVVIIDPKGSDYSLYKNANLLTPNLSEFRLIAEQYNFSKEEILDESNEKKIAQTIIKDLNLTDLLITKSENGMTLHQKNGEVYHQFTYAEDVYDVTGAGDTVIATLASAIATGVEIKDACYLANKAAGVSVAKLGAATVSMDELRKSCNIETSQRSLSFEQVVAQIREKQKAGEKVVFTNGCFDLLHRGHLSYLQRAKELGDILVVAINSDSSVKRLKGDSRPINSLDDRMFMLSSLKYVDYVVSFDEDTPLDVIKLIRPDVLVKGADYQVEDIVGYKEVTSYGGKVQTITFIDSYSSTNLINKIKNN
ncbi:D-glycero-beta-D-manno-heptose 1-phosphate adenylyltransferase [Psittacicella hinzii]|uniref:Bifunctional protein HldE n=1 Tax=Psittacicella hinzii TaxID=2028575 RepID=A0A3A1Y988_9GAMM|nr:bifunctional D-glycero-beta-D-manno-heptose-7-phosphate kinase/D-glycero-beta-D-manno-heptose 1-phosphate adenylyltransferase HldE [Psittacicella hinzii]RIY33780.1 D-glycero-beta-D-manno-heptose 1-phosphate adenylyltransferase [Psittacicella hinzii]